MKQEVTLRECDGCCQRICDHSLEKCCYLVKNECILTKEDKK